MKALLISVHAKWCALMMNGIKKIEVRKGTALYKAIQKLIDENGFANIYVYCAKDHSLIYTDGIDGKGDYVDYKYYESYKGDKNDIGSGKVIFKFRCYKVEEIPTRRFSVCTYPYAETLDDYELLDKSCLSVDELENYLGNNTGCAIHISNLEIFDKPKELCEFYKVGFEQSLKDALKEPPYPLSPYSIQKKYALTKAPQSFAYIEV